MAKKNFKNNNKGNRKPNNNNQKPKQKRVKFTPVIYKKMLGDFSMVLDELREIIGDHNNIFDGCTTLVDANKALVTYVNNNIPDLESKSNIHTSLSIGVNRASLKTEDAYSFGWYVNYSVENKVAVITSVEISFTLFRENASLTEKLEANNWYIPEK